MDPRLQALAAFALVASSAALASSCDLNPVHTDAVNALGPEVAGIPTGEYHRAGQPCLTCHGGEGPAKAQFTVAGTVFYGPANNTASPIGVGGAVVTLEDDTTVQFSVTTDCVGNFYLRPGDWPSAGGPYFPLLVTISGTVGTFSEQSMQSHIGRTGSCADCHQYITTQNYFQTPGLVHLYAADNPSFQGTDPNCPVDPVPPGYGAGP